MPNLDESTVNAIKSDTVDCQLSASATGHELCQWSLNWTDSAGSQRQHLITHAPTKIGNSARCEIRLTDHDSKPLHVVLNESNDSVIARSWVEGSQLNGAHFTTSPLSEGDVITVGNQDFELQWQNNEEMPAGAEFAASAYAASDASHSNGLEEELRDRIAQNYQRAKRLLSALRIERSEVLHKSKRVEELEQLLSDFSTQVESISEENATLRSNSIELEQALIEAHEYLSTIRDHGFVEDDELTSTESAETESAYEPETVCSSEFDSENHYELSNTESEIEPSSKPSHISENQSIETIEDELHTSPCDLSEYDRTVEDISDELDVTADSLIVEDIVEQEVTAPEPADSWQVEKSIAEDQATLPPTEVAESTQEFAQEERIDELFGAHLAMEPEKGEPFVPTSFIDNYTNQDEETYDSPREALEAEHHQEPIDSELSFASEIELTNTESTDESADTMDNYLQAMMARIAGQTDGKHEVEASSVANQPEQDIESPIDSSEIESEELPKFQDLSELCKSFAPERGTDMQTLRNLANDSARQAIQTAQADQWKSNAIRKFGSVGIGLIGSFVGLVTAPSLTSIQSILCICLILAWGYAGLRALISSQADATLDIDLQAHVNQASEA